MAENSKNSLVGQFKLATEIHYWGPRETRHDFRPRSAMILSFKRCTQALAVILEFRFIGISIMPNNQLDQEPEVHKGLLMEDTRIEEHDITSSIAKDTTVSGLTLASSSCSSSSSRDKEPTASSKSKSKSKSSASSNKPSPTIGRWTKDEHELFLTGLANHGKSWKKIAQMIRTRTLVQIRTHAQKYLQKKQWSDYSNTSSNNNQDQHQHHHVLHQLSVKRIASTPQHSYPLFWGPGTPASTSEYHHHQQHPHSGMLMLPSHYTHALPRYPSTPAQTQGQRPIAPVLVPSTWDAALDLQLPFPSSFFDSNVSHAPPPASTNEPVVVEETDLCSKLGEMHAFSPRPPVFARRHEEEEEENEKDNTASYLIDPLPAMHDSFPGDENLDWLAECISSDLDTILPDEPEKIRHQSCMIPSPTKKEIQKKRRLLQPMMMMDASNIVRAHVPTMI